MPIESYPTFQDMGAVLAEALGYLEGNITAQFPAGDHIVHVMEVIAAGAGEMLHEEQPMVHVRKSGLSY